MAVRAVTHEVSSLAQAVQNDIPIGGTSCTRICAMLISHQHVRRVDTTYICTKVDVRELQIPFKVFSSLFPSAPGFSISRQDGAYLAIVIIVDVLGAVKPAINCYSGYLRTAHETHNVGGLSQ